jgi:hypothetical protein
VSVLRRAVKREGAISTKHVLLSDIGATNARFALLSNGALGSVKSFDVTGFARFEDATATFLKDHCQQIEITNAVLAIAGPVKGQRCELTNCSWVIDARELRETFKFEARIVNDFEAVFFLAVAHRGGCGGHRRWQTRSGGADGRAGSGDWIGCRLSGARGRKADRRFK